SNPHSFRFGPNDAYQPVEVWKIFFPKSWSSNFHDGAAFKDKVIVVGASAQIQHDFIATPLDPNTPGPALHLHAMAAAIARDYLGFTPAAVCFLLVIIAGVVA